MKNKKIFLWLLPALWAGMLGCVGRQARELPALQPEAPPPIAAPAIPADANCVLIVAEAIGTPDEDTASYTKIYIDGKPAGQTAIGPRSQEKKWGAKLAAGNHVFRFEKWDLPAVGDWAILDAQWQPPERFIRVDESGRTTIRLKFYDGGHGHDLQIEREALSAPRQ